LRASKAVHYDLDARRRGARGETILFLHGEDGAADHEAFLAALATRAIVLAPTLPGYDLSPVPQWLDDMQDLAMFLRDWLRDQDVRRVHLVGHSLGGWLAAELATLDATRLASLTLVAPGGLRHPSARMYDIFMNAPPDVARMSVHEAELGERLARACDDPATTDTRLQNRFMTARLGWQPRFYSARLEKWLARVTLPTQLVWGADDRILPRAFASGFETRLSGSRTHILPSCGHHPPLEQPQELASLILNFAEEHAS
jgi:pimeloyl-ACP methyl ester carboxylesterase